MLCFGGGILLSTVLIHMLREVRESLERATDLGMIPETLEYPFAELLVGMGKTSILSKIDKSNPQIKSKELHFQVFCWFSWLSLWCTNSSEDTSTDILTLQVRKLWPRRLSLLRWESITESIAFDQYLYIKLNITFVKVWRFPNVAKSVKIFCFF